MSRIIHVTNNGLITEGIVAANEPIYTTKIFIDDPENLLGFRRRLDYHTQVKDKQLVEYIEIGHFMEMLFEGKYDAFKILKMTKEHVVDSLFDFELLRKQESELVSLNLVNGLVKESEELFSILEDPKELGIEVKENNNEFLIEKLAYNNKNAYICLRNLMLAEGVLKHDKFEFNLVNTNVLQKVRDGAFGLSAIKDGYDLHMGRIKKLTENVEMRIRPDRELMDKVLMDIRNVEINLRNVARNQN